MFENEAEERTKQYMNEYEEKYNCENTKLETDNYNAGLEQGYEDGFQDGAEFGYNKANEWHYPSKGEYPKENKQYLCKVKAFVGGGITYECFDYDIEYNSWKGACGDVIAWKEIIFPVGG